MQKVHRFEPERNQRVNGAPYVAAFEMQSQTVWDTKTHTVNVIVGLTNEHRLYQGIKEKKEWCELEGNSLKYFRVYLRMFFV